jgi:hypothetical protein
MKRARPRRRDRRLGRDMSGARGYPHGFVPSAGYHDRRKPLQTSGFARVVVFTGKYGCWASARVIGWAAASPTSLRFCHIGGVIEHEIGVAGPQVPPARFGARNDPTKPALDAGTLKAVSRQRWTRRGRIRDPQRIERVITCFGAWSGQTKRRFPPALAPNLLQRSCERRQHRAVDRPPTLLHPPTFFRPRT